MNRNLVIAAVIGVLAVVGIAAMTVFKRCDSKPGGALFQIVDARDSVTGTLISRIRISAVKRDGQTVLPRSLLNSYAENINLENLKISNSALVCDLECSFGEIEGDYALTYEAVGYAPKIGTTSGHYANRSNECPAVLTGSTELGLTLDPRAPALNIPK
jgi:hypothetical protein